MCMTKDEAVKTIGLYRGKVEKIEKKIRYIQAQQEYRDFVWVLFTEYRLLDF